MSSVILKTVQSKGDYITMLAVYQCLVEVKISFLIMKHFFSTEVISFPILAPGSAVQSIN